MPKAKNRVHVVTAVDEIKVKGGVPHLLMEVDGKLRRYAFSWNTLIHIQRLGMKVLDKAITNQHTLDKGEVA